MRLPFKFNIKKKINYQNTSKECKKYSVSHLFPWNSKEKCSNKYAFKDEFGREWKYCMKHGCRICTSEIKINKHGDPHDLGNGFSVCRRSSCENIMIKNSQKINELIKGRDELKWNLKGILTTNSALEKLIDKLTSLEEAEIALNVESEPIISSEGLEAIKRAINHESSLTIKEKMILEKAYDYEENGGRVGSIIGEKTAAFTEIIGLRKKVEEKLNQDKEDFIKVFLEKEEGWNLLTDDRKEKYRADIRKMEHSGHFNLVLNQAKEEIRKIKENNKDNNIEREREREREREPKSPEPPTTAGTKGQFRPIGSNFYSSISLPR